MWCSILFGMGRPRIGRQADPTATNVAQPAVDYPTASPRVSFDGTSLTVGARSFRSTRWPQ